MVSVPLQSKIDGIEKRGKSIQKGCILVASLRKQCAKMYTYAAFRRITFEKSEVKNCIIHGLL